MMDRISSWSCSLDAADREKKTDAMRALTSHLQMSSHFPDEGVALPQFHFSYV